MTFREAEAVKIPFGKYKGRELGKVGESDAGLKYLDWLVGQGRIFGSFKWALDRYMSEQLIQQELERILN